MLYQWGRKDPFTFATSSLQWGVLVGAFEYGEYPIKIYNGKSELIYQEDRGGTNSGKTPVGGVVAQKSAANSMIEIVRKPNVFYDYNYGIISQIGHSKELWDYYWTSYSKGTDGKRLSTNTTPHWHNTYLDGYIVLRSKSIYDPCPYGYRIPTNGTYNDFISNQGWTIYSYTGGAVWICNWFAGTGYRYRSVRNTGNYKFNQTSTASTEFYNYVFSITSSNSVQTNRANWEKMHSNSVRCIEDATGKADKKGAAVRLKLLVDVVFFSYRLEPIR